MQVDSSARRAPLVTALALAAASGLAQAGVTDRYWVAPVLGTWDDAANWSLSEGGPAGGGLPQSDDTTHFTDRSICVYDGPGAGFPIFNFVNIAGTGSGRTQLLQSNGLFNAETVVVGNGTLRNDLKVSGGILSATSLTVAQFAGGEGLLEISGTGSVSKPGFNRLIVGFADADGLVDIQGGSAEFDEVYLSVDSNLGDPGGAGELLITGGTLDIGEWYIGQGGRGFARLWGGTTTVSTECVIGRVGESGGLRPQLNIATGATLNINGALQIGDFDEINGEAPGDGRLLITGGTADVSAVTIAENLGTDGELIVEGGSFSATAVRVGLGGDGTVELNGGSFIATNLDIGGSEFGSGLVDINGGVQDIGTVRVGASPDGDGKLYTYAGTMNADEFRVGLDGDGLAILYGGTLDTPLLRVGGVLTNDAQLTVYGATLIADEIEVARDMNGLDPNQFFVREGLVISNELRIMPDADARIGFGFPFDARISAIINDGSFDFSGSGSILSGQIFFGNIRLLGNFYNNGDFSFRSGAPDDAFAMNLINTSDFDIGANVNAVVGGAITNEATGTILVRRDSIADPGRLVAQSANGLINNGALELDLGLVAIPNGKLTNNGTLTGFGEIDGEVLNNGQILPDPNAIERELSVDGLVSGPASSVRFVITASGHNTIVLPTGDADLNGTLNIAFAQGVPFPPQGTEYELIRCDDGNLENAFSGESILGYPCEIVYEPARVLARTLRCSVADFTPPYGVLDLTDINTFIASFTGGSPLADINGDTFLDLADINAFVAAFNAGCP